MQVLLIASALLLGTLFTQASQAVTLRINAGGPTYTDSASNVWSADTGSIGGSTVDWGAQAIGGTSDPTLYQTERYGSDLQYNLAVPNGTYQVNLYFAENYVKADFPNGGIGFRVFSVEANGVTIVSNLDLFAQVGAQQAVIKSATVNVTNGQLVLSSPSGWFVNAIEVIGQSAVADTTPPTVPASLTNTPLSTTQIQLNWSASTDVDSGVGGYHVFRDGVQVGTTTAAIRTLTDSGLSANTAYSYTVTAFDLAVPANESAPSSPSPATTLAVNNSTVLRIESGGGAYTDSASNLWSADSGFNSSSTVNWGAQAIGGTSDPTLYQTERYGANLQYSFTVPNGTYQVSLYFAENYVNSTFPNGGIGYRVFSVQANGVTIVPNLDVFAVAGAHNALIKTATVNVTNGQLVLSAPGGWFVNAIQITSQSIVSDTTPPSVPTGVTATPQSSSAVQLSWNASTDAGSGVGGYRVLRNGSSVTTVSGTSYLDTGRAPGTTYNYSITAFDLANPVNESAPSAAVPATTPANTDTTPPTVPTGLVATPLSTSSISLQWAASSDVGEGVGGYHVFRDGTQVGATLAGVTTYTDPGLTANTSYSYTVTAFDLAVPFNESAPSSPSPATTLAPDTTPPTVPANLINTPLSTTQIQLNWSASTDAGTGVGGYHVFRDGSQVGATTAGIRTFTDSGLSANTAYSYTVTAFDLALPANESVPSSPSPATTLAVDNSTVVRVEAGGGAYTDSASNLWSADTGFNSSSTVDWGSQAIGGTSDPTLYRTERYGANLQYTFTVPNGTYQVSLYFAENYVNSEFPNGGIGYRVFSVLANGVTIVPNLDVFAVAGAHNALIKTATVNVTNGQLVLSSPGGWFVNAIQITSQSIVSDTTPPSIPTGVTATPQSSSTVQLSWNASTDSGAGVGGYRVLRDGSSVTTVSGTSYLDTGRAPGTTYSYTITAFDLANPVNESAPSAAVPATTPANTDTTPPTVPTGLVATPLNSSSISLLWNASSDVGAGVAGYHVFRDGVQVGSTLAGVTTYTDLGLSANTSYSYTVTAFDLAVPFNESVPSSPSPATTQALDSTPPTVPANLTATPQSTSQIQLSWSASTDAGTGVGGYHVSRDGVQIATATAGATGFLDTGLNAATQYGYSISAFDLASPANESAPTSVVLATTLTANTGTALRIEAGGGAYTDSASNLWSADAGFTSSFTVNWGSQPIGGTSDPTLYQTERYGPNFLYSFTVPNGTYQVSLYFAENYVNSTFPNGGIGYRVFSVQANGITIIPNLDVFAVAGAHNALIKTATVTVNNGQLVLSSPNAGWFVDAIQITGQAAGPDSTPPSIPTGLGAQAISNSSIQLSWNASTDIGTGVGGYRVFRNGVPVTTVSNTAYADIGLAASTQYSYTVSAFDQANPVNESTQSGAAIATTLAAPDLTPPSVPTGLTASALSSSSIQLGWNASTDTQSGVAGYRIFRNGVSVGTTNSTTWPDVGLAASTQYTYTVSAFDLASPANESTPSASASATTQAGTVDITPPSVPNGLTANALNSSSIQLGWNVSTDTQSGVAGYRVFRNGSPVTTVSGNSYVDFGLNASTQYSYTVTAFDGATPANESTQSGSASATTTVFVASQGWDWVGGSQFVLANGVYGNQGVAAPGNTPGSRYQGVTWKDNSGNLWLFSGSGTDVFGNHGRLSDLWKYNTGSQQWTWVGGSAVVDTAGVYGTKGVTAPSNMPGGRSSAVTWTDPAGNLWLFGGASVSSTEYIFLNDLWKYEPSSGLWTWVTGSNTTDVAGVYGTQGVAAPGNTPGSRKSAVGWTDSAGNLWLFGGTGADSTGARQDLNDLWKFSPSSGLWTWVSGGATGDTFGTYGTQGVAAPGNSPGARQEAQTFTDTSGNLWLFGGFGPDFSSTAIFGHGEYNDLWKFSPASGLWTWVSGTTTGGSPGVYGIQGVAAPGNRPGARSSAGSWTDAAGNFWMLGGFGFDSAGTWYGLNDLWKYQPSTGQWTWVKGSTLVNGTASYGFQGSPGSGNVPGARNSMMTWTDNAGSLWLFGGIGLDANGNYAYLNDLWKF